jgi:ubiquinone/menaquinone biosynthesis C-methylase UbiE
MDAAVHAGQAIYSKPVLAAYDLWVLGFSTHLLWRCPTKRLLAHYNRHLRGNHLDVGVGSGYFLDKCRFPAARPRLGLMDVNPNSLSMTARRVRRYHPEQYRANVLEPLDRDIPAFDSIGMNYLLHCLPGCMEEKSPVFGHLRPLLNPGGIIFGSTLLSDQPRNPVADQLMRFYNRKGIFSNRGDDLDALRWALTTYFVDVTLETRGTVALFSARNPVNSAGSAS